MKLFLQVFLLKAFIMLDKLCIWNTMQMFKNCTLFSKFIYIRFIRLVDAQKESSGFGRFTKIEEDSDAPPAPDEPPQKDDEGESSGAESDGDGDTISAKSKMRHNQELEYEDPEEEEVLPEESGMSVSISKNAIII